MKTLTLTSILSLLLVFSFNYANAYNQNINVTYDQTFSVTNDSTQNESVSIIYTEGEAFILDNEPQSWGCAPDSNHITCATVPPNGVVNVGLTPDAVYQTSTGHVNISEDVSGSENSWYYQITTSSYGFVALEFSPYKNRNGVPFTSYTDDYEDPANKNNININY